MKKANTLNEMEEPRMVLECADGEGVTAPRDREVSLLDVAIVLAKRRRSILRTTLATILVATLLAFVLPVRYTATTTILPPQQGGSAGSAILSQLGALGSLAGAAGGSLGLKNPNELQIALLKSRTVEDAVIDRFHLMAQFHVKLHTDARDKLEKVIDIKDSTKDPLIRVSATDRDPQRAADLANGYVDEFKKFSATLAVTEASQRRIFFENQLRQAKDNLASAEEDLKKTQDKTGLIQLDSQTRAAIETAASLRAQVTAKEVQISALRSFATGDNPELQMAEQELSALQAQMSKIGAAATGAAPSLPNGAMQQEGLEYVRKLRNVRYSETIFELLARQLEAAKVDEARQGAMVQTVDSAVKPERHSSPKRTWILIGSVVLGLFFGVFWALASEGIERLKNNPEERARLQTLEAELGSRKRTHRAATETHV